MICTRIHKIRKTELFNIAEALESRGIKQSYCKILDLNVSMDRVFDYLHDFTKRIFIYNA